jgi:hypothetical protein
MSGVEMALEADETQTEGARSHRNEPEDIRRRNCSSVMCEGAPAGRVDRARDVRRLSVDRTAKGAELARYVVEKGEPLLTLVK